MKIWTFDLDGRQVHLVDTPGFDDTNRSDTDVLKDLAYWLGLSYERKKIRLTGLIYLHPITHTRMAGTAFKNLRTFKKLVGSESMASVALVSTMWGETSDADEERRDLILRETPEFWKSMIDQGAKPYRHTRSQASALTIIRPLLGKIPTVLNLQHELVDQGKNLNHTEAGKEVDAGISLQREMLERKIEDTKTEMTQALAAKDQKWIDQLAADQEKYERQVKETRSAQEEMKLSMEKIFAEKEEQYKKSIREMDDKLQEIESQRQDRERQFEAEREAARQQKAEADRRVAEHEEAAAKAQNEADVANLSSFMTQLTMLMGQLDKREASENQNREELQKAFALAQMQKENDMQEIRKEAQRLEEEKAMLAQRQREHQMAMMMGPPPPYPWPNQQQQPMQQQYYDQSAASVGGAALGAGLGLAAGAAGLTMCSIM